MESHHEQRPEGVHLLFIMQIVAGPGPTSMKENAPELQKVRAAKKRRKVDAFTHSHTHTLRQEIGVRIE